MEKLMSRKNIGELLLEYDLINEEDLKKALEFQKTHKVRLGEALVDLGKITERDIEYILSKQLNIPYILVDNLILDEQLIKEFDKNFLIDNRILPIYETESEISIVTDDPFNKEAIEKVKQIKKKKINLSSGNANAILNKLKSIFSLTETQILKKELINILEELKETEYYRIDFRFFENNISVCAFDGNSISFITEIKMSLSVKSILNSLFSIDLIFFYEILGDNDFLMIFPAKISEQRLNFPVTINKFSIPVPTGTTFSDMENLGIENVIKSDKPVYGYPYISLKKKTDYLLSVNLYIKQEEKNGKN
jgi:type IV pilus assembly protein PilB